MEPKNLLLLEDESEIAELVTVALEGVCNIEHAQNLSQACEMVNLNKYHMIIADRHLPDGDGISLVNELAESRNKGIPLLFLSGMIDEESKVEGLVKGAVDYIEKPFSSRELRVRVSKSLSKNRF